ncbi:MAG: insulinase family protein, partial [Elusimicrobiales bacterium]|nr:insulinase family protein [Elusimicrobiales bacterium]
THFKQAYLMYGYFAPSIKIENFKKYLSLKLLNLYLGGGMSGKLFEILREEKSLCYETNCFYPTKFLDSHFVIYLGLDAKKINIAKQEIEKILNYLKYNGITQQELSECKNKLKGRYLLDHQTNLRQAWYLGFWEVLGLDYRYDKKYIEELENVSLDDIKNVIHEITEVKPYILELIPK